MGRIIRIDQKRVTIHSVDNGEIESKSAMDIFAKGRYIFKNLPIDVVSDKRRTDHYSFSKLLIRELIIEFANLDETEQEGIDNLVAEMVII